MTEHKKTHAEELKLKCKKCPHIAKDLNELIEHRKRHWREAKRKSKLSKMKKGSSSNNEATEGIPTSSKIKRKHEEQDCNSMNASSLTPKQTVSKAKRRRVESVVIPFVIKEFKHASDPGFLGKMK